MTQSRKFRPFLPTVSVAAAILAGVVPAQAQDTEYPRRVPGAAGFLFGFDKVFPVVIAAAPMAPNATGTKPQNRSCEALPAQAVDAVAPGRGRS